MSPSMPDRSARSTPPDSPAGLRDIAYTEAQHYAGPVLGNIRQVFANAADRASLDGRDPRESVTQSRDSLIRCIDQAYVDELARWTDIGR